MSLQGDLIRLAHAQPSLRRSLLPLVLQDKPNRVAGGYYFRKAKVPKTLYHGTTAAFDKFDLREVGKRDTGNLGRGSYLATKKRIAMSYAEDNVKRWGGEPIVLEVEHNLRSTALFDAGLFDLLEQEGFTFPPTGLDKDRAERMRNWFLSNGFDSAMTPAGEVVVYKPERLKIRGIADVKTNKEYTQAIWAYFQEHGTAPPKEWRDRQGNRVYYWAARDPRPVQPGFKVPPARTAQAPRHKELEAIFERVRREQFPDKPSRIGAIYVCPSRTGFCRPDNKWGAEGGVYEVKVRGNTFLTNASYYTEAIINWERRHDVEEATSWAEAYWGWTGKVPGYDFSEVIVQGTATVLRPAE